MQAATPGGVCFGLHCLAHIRRAIDRELAEDGIKPGLLEHIVNILANATAGS